MKAEISCGVRYYPAFYLVNVSLTPSDTSFSADSYNEDLNIKNTFPLPLRELDECKNIEELGDKFCAVTIEKLQDIANKENVSIELKRADFISPLSVVLSNPYSPEEINKYISQNNFTEDEHIIINAPFLSRENFTVETYFALEEQEEKLAQQTNTLDVFAES